MKPLSLFDVSGHSNEYSDWLIRTKGRIARYELEVAPAVKLVRKLGRAPTVIERAPGSPFGNSGFSIAEFAAIPYAEWSAYVKHITLPQAALGKREAQPPTVYQPYLASAEFATEAAWEGTSGRLFGTQSKAWIENVIDHGQAIPRMQRLREYKLLAGREPVPDRHYPIADPWIVDETLLLLKGTDFKGGGTWPQNWITLAPGQDRTLILPDRDATMDEVLEREAFGWKVAVRPHRVRALA